MMKKTTFCIIVLAFIVVLAAIIYISIENKNKDKYEFKENTFYYSQSRGTPNYNISLKEENENTTTYKVNFESRSFLDYKTTIYGLLIMPKNMKNVPGLILLPGGSVTKETESTLGTKIANLGYVVLTFDQRGVGETGGYYLGLEEDYKVFSQGKEPIQHLSVYDVLKAYDVLKKIKEVDKNNIGIAGESMGGRYAIIAASMDKRMKGVIVISSSGFHIQNENQPYTPYLISIDPDHYVGKISPNYVFMIHSSNDSVISLNDSKITFNLAKEPKKFYEVNNCPHGYCEAMYNELQNDLKTLFEK